MKKNANPTSGKAFLVCIAALLIEIVARCKKMAFYKLFHKSTCRCFIVRNPYYICIAILR